MPPTRLKDIAEAAKVSVMTVSRALRQAPDVSLQTQERIRRLADQMGYSPNANARGLRNRTNGLIGLVISATTNPVFARMILAIEEAARERQFQVVLAQSLNRPELEDQAIRGLLSRRVDGLLVSPVYRLEPVAPIFEELRARNLPTVLLGQGAPFCSAFSGVATDDLAASAQLTQHLLELGHVRIAYLAGPSVSPAAQERLEGYRRTLREAGVEPQDEWVFKAGTTIEEGVRAALQLLQEQPTVTAVQAYNDLVAIGASTILLQQGLSIPGAISVVGFGNILLSEHFRVPLTTSRQPKFRLGVAAVDMLMRLLNGEKTSSKRLPADIMIRASTGPPRASKTL